MINLCDIELRGVVTYENQKLAFNKHKLVRVSGQNLDRHSTRSTNAAGKSLLFTTLGSVLLNFVKTHASKGEKNTLLRGKDAYAAVSLEKNGTKYKIIQYQKGSTRWDIEENGIKKSFRETKEALHFIRSNILNISEQQFYSQVVVDGRSKTLLQSGTSKQRFDYFEEVFKLNAYDYLAEQANKDYARLKRLQQDSEVVAKELNEKLNELPEEALEELQAKQIEVQAKFDKIRATIEALSNEQSIISTYLALAVNSQSVKSLKQLQEDLVEAETEEKTINELREKAIRFKEQQKHEKQIKTKRKELQEEINKHPSCNLSVEKLQNRFDRLEQQLSIKKDLLQEQQNKINNNKIIKANLKRIKEGNEAFFLKYTNVSTKKLEKTISNNQVERKNLIASVASLEEYLETHDHDNKSVCPTCLRDLTPVAAKSMIELARQKIEKCAKNVFKLKMLLSYNDEKEKLQLLNKNINLEELENWITQNAEKNKKRGVLITKLQKRERLQQELNNLPKISNSLNRCPPPEVYDELSKGLKQRFKILHQVIDAKLRLQKLNLHNKFKSTKQAQIRQKQVLAKLNKYRPMIDKAQKILSRLSGKISVVEIVSSDIERLTANLKDLQSKTKNIKVYEALRKAFGPKGLRKQKTVFFAEKLQQNLNKYAGLIYGEPIRFKIEVSNTKLDILAERNGKIDDVRSLSGAESSAFTLLLIVCMLPFVKSSDRFNLLVLDEIESGLDDPSKALFVEKYLPILQQIVKHIVIITPASEQSFYIPNAYKITVVKKNGVSTLKHGL